MKNILLADNEIHLTLICEQSQISFYQDESYSDDRLAIYGKVKSDIHSESIKYYDWLQDEHITTHPHNFKFKILIKLDIDLDKSFTGTVLFKNFMSDKDKRGKEVDPGLQIEMSVSSEKIFEKLMAKTNTTSRLVMGLYVDVPNMEDNLLRTWDVTKDKQINITRYFVYNNNDLQKKNG